MKYNSNEFSFYEEMWKIKINKTKKSKIDRMKVNKIKIKWRLIKNIIIMWSFQPIIINQYYKDRDYSGLFWWFELIVGCGLYCTCSFN